MLPIRYEFFLASALEKVFPTAKPTVLADGSRLSCWRGTRVSVQLVYCAALNGAQVRTNELRFDISVTGAPCEATLRHVDLAPVMLPVYETADDHYLGYDPGLYPDILRPMAQPIVTPHIRQYRSVWLTWDVPADAQPGAYDISITAKTRAIDESPNGKVVVHEGVDDLVFTQHLTLNVCHAEMPEQQLIHTEWFHTDCLCDYYCVEAMSEEYWRITENYIRTATHHGINMILTPIFTPPLDTAVGAERPTIQLVDITVKDGAFRFDFAKLERWLALCRKHAVRYLEIPHFFTQWGAKATPKIVATIDGREQRIFGWDIPATSPMYRAFLEEFIPLLRAKLTEQGYDQAHVYYHVSDEPHLDQLADYSAARNVILDLLDGCPIIDALSNLEFYQKGVVEHPIPSADHIQPFLDAHVPDLWTYYCCGQVDKVPNRFLAMPSVRNRIMGVLMYVNRIVGFLQWGYNFYYSRCSGYLIDPYQVTDGDYAYPAGDPFIVYPGQDGAPVDSLRAEVQYDGFLDMRALSLLESLAGREAVEALIYDGAAQPMTFDHYPHDAAYLLSLRERVADTIDAFLTK